MLVDTILNRVSVVEVLDLIGEYYYDGDYEYSNRQGFLKTIQELCQTTYLKSNDGLILTINHYVDEYDGDEFEQVSAIKKDESFSWSLSLTPWAEWLGLEVSKETLNKYTEGEIMAHILWEMTFYGFDSKSVESQRAEIFQLSEDAKNDPSSYVSMDELFADYDIDSNLTLSESFAKESADILDDKDRTIAFFQKAGTHNNDGTLTERNSSGETE